jgi:LPS export ABC transporter protein LptC
MKGKFSLVLSIILALGILVLLGYKDDSININPSYRTSSMSGIHLNHKEGNRLKWELFARTATFPEDKKDILIDSIELKIHNEPDIYITGGTGSYNIENKTLDVRDKIKINLKDGVFKTESLRWKGNEGMVTSANNVEFISDRFTIAGTGLIADIDKEEIRILKNVKGTFYR